MTEFTSPAAGAILVGGRARRMGGGDKCLSLLGGKSILARIIETFSPQVSALLLNANGDSDRFSNFELPILPDSVGDYAGPLAGILTSMRWAEGFDFDWLVTVAGDAPFIPDDLVSRCLDRAKRTGADIVCVASGGRTHPVCGLWNVSLAENLENALVNDGVRKIDKWTSGFGLAVEKFNATPVDPFFNVNSPTDLNEAEVLLSNFL